MHLMSPCRTNHTTGILSIISLISDRLAVITSQDSMFQWLTGLSVKNLFLKTSLNFLLSSFIPLKQLWFSERGSLSQRGKHLPLYCFTSVGSPSFLFSKMHKTSDLNVPLKSCPWVISPSAWSPSSEYTPEFDVLPHRSWQFSIVGKIIEWIYIWFLCPDRLQKALNSTGPKCQSVRTQINITLWAQTTRQLLTQSIIDLSCCALASLSVRIL